MNYFMKHIILYEPPMVYDKLCTDLSPTYTQARLLVYHIENL